MTAVSRRALFQSLVGSAIAQQTFRVQPQSHGSHQSEDEGDPYARAAAAPATAWKGFDPDAYLRAFDRGVTSRRANGQIVREYELVARDVELEIAPGIVFPAWTFNGQVPGPTLRCTEGDFVRVHFRNDSLSDHTVHFHGIHSAAMDGSSGSVKPKQSFVYEFTAEPAGLQLYHCHVAPVALHMNRGLFGVFLIDPRQGRPRANEMVMVMHGWDVDFDGRNELWAINGPVNAYRDRPIALAAGETARVHLVNVVEYDPVVSFHLHANFFDLHPGSFVSQPPRADIVTLTQAERAILEFSFGEPGVYMFHPHQNAMAERGCMGHFAIRERIKG